MYSDDLEERNLSVDQIFLDPNNPRFWTEKITRDIADRRIPDADVQTRTAKDIESHGIQELLNSILRNGFLKLDRIVVREIKGQKDKYVAVEGNRRLAALKLLRQRIKDETIDEDGLSLTYLENLHDSTDVIPILVYQGSDTQEISWLLQGIRHISGIRDWAPAQRARLLADQIDKHGLRFREAGQTFGLTPQAVGRLYRSYKALEQMRQDDEFQTKARNNYFTLFEEAYRSMDVRKWLDWNDQEHLFENEDNLQQFYSWITPDDDHPDKRRRIHDPRQIKQLASLVASNHQDLLSQFDSHEISIENAYERATMQSEADDWIQALGKVSRLLSNIPQSAFQEGSEQLLAKLEDISTRVKTMEKMATAAVGGE